MDEKFGFMMVKRKGEVLWGKRDRTDKATLDGWEPNMWKASKDDSRRKWEYSNIFLNKEHMQMKQCTPNDSI